MKLKRIFCILILLSVCISIPIKLSFSNSQYELSLRKGTVLIYEYSSVNKTLLDFLAQFEPSYYELSDIPEGFTIKWIISNIQEQENNWTINANLYTGDTLNNYSGNLQSFCFKLPEFFSISVFNSSDLFLDFLPMNVTDYLLEFSNYIPESYNDTCYSIENSIIFDFTSIGYNDTIIYQYNTQGILENYFILCDDQVALSRVLVKIDMQEEPFPSFIIFIILIVSIFCITVFIVIYKLKLKKKFSKKNKVRKYLRHIK